MNHFTSVHDIDKLSDYLAEAKLIKQNPFQWSQLGKHKTLGLIFFNSSLRTRLSTQKAAYNLGMNVIVMNVSADAWQLEFADGAIMDAGKAEHIKDAAPVMGQYCDIIGIRAFAALKDREADDQEEVMEAFKRYAGVPIVSLESATLHPLQSLADMITIDHFKRVAKPKIVLTWAPHPRALPQAVPNSFSQWVLKAGLDFTITHPAGYELSETFTKGAVIEHDQAKAFEGADFVYAKNWSSYQLYGQILSKDPSWTITTEKMAHTNQAYLMHCLPLRRNVVVADELVDSPQSLVIQQAANREVSAQLVLKKMLEGMRET